MTIKPVTHTAEVAVKRASINLKSTPGGVARGSIKRPVPTKMMAPAAKATICPGRSRIEATRLSMVRLGVCVSSKVGIISVPLLPAYQGMGG